jgi:hypothetical protein
LAVFLLAAQVAQQCLVTPEKSALTFSTESSDFATGNIPERDSTADGGNDEPPVLSSHFVKFISSPDSGQTPRIESC